VTHDHMVTEIAPCTCSGGMSNSTWTIFPPVSRSQVIDVLSAETVCEHDNVHMHKLLTRFLFPQCIQIVSESDNLFTSVCNILEESNDFAFLLLRDMPVYTLICPHFIDAFVRTGSLYGVSGWLFEH